MKQLLKSGLLLWYQTSSLAKTYLLLTFIRLGLKFLSFQRLYGWLTQWTAATAGTGRQQTADSVPVRVASRTVHLCSNWMVPAPKCLTRALCVYFIVRRHGGNPILKLGVTKNSQDQLAAHAWVEVQGEVVIGGLPNLKDYIPLPAL